ncbi:hypothetical protein KY343_06420 [Candidatus Woesearchaeota archaeon]|nr:hypothetical protein [Candidatus Woesearchaeota archaeon]
MGKSVILVGPRCCGKTQTGLALSEILDIPFVDADEWFVNEHGSVDSYVTKNGGLPEGWKAFRKAETDIIEGICEEYRGIQIVLTPGGGAVAHDHGEEYRQRNVELLKEFGDIIYLLPLSNLEASSKILHARSQDDKTTAEQRPSLTGKKPYEDMLVTVTKRHPLYSAAATSGKPFYTGEKNIKEVAQEIAEKLR